ncbi:MAG: hypothetical protein WDW38_001311 [Sanguina aurantia]
MQHWREASGLRSPSPSVHSLQLSQGPAQVGGSPLHRLTGEGGLCAPCQRPPAAPAQPRSTGRCSVTEKRFAPVSGHAHDRPAAPASDLRAVWVPPSHATQCCMMLLEASRDPLGVPQRSPSHVLAQPSRHWTTGLTAFGFISKQPRTTGF